MCLHIELQQNIVSGLYISKVYVNLMFKILI